MPQWMKLEVHIGGLPKSFTRIITQETVRDSGIYRKPIRCSEIHGDDVNISKVLEKCPEEHP
jgi:hypothetical protein